MGRKIFVGFVALLLATNIGYLVNPSTFSITGQQLTVPAALTDVRSIYGGIAVGLALYLGLSLSGSNDLKTELRLIALVFAGAAAGRLTGIVLDGGDQGSNLLFFTLEAAVSIFAVILLIRSERFRVTNRPGTVGGDKSSS